MTSVYIDKNFASTLKFMPKQKKKFDDVIFTKCKKYV